MAFGMVIITSIFSLSLLLCEGMMFHNYFNGYKSRITILKNKNLKHNLVKQRMLMANLLAPQLLDSSDKRILKLPLASKRANSKQSREAKYASAQFVSPRIAKSHPKKNMMNQKEKMKLTCKIIEYICSNASNPPGHSHILVYILILVRCIMFTVRRKCFDV